MMISLTMIKTYTPILMTVVRMGLGTLFIYSGLPKIRLPYVFLGNVYDFELVGPQLGVFVAMVLPWVEVFVGVCLLGGIFIGGALLVSVGMSLMFAVALMSALHRGLDIACGCFSSAPDGTIIGYFTLFRTSMILVSAATVYGLWYAPLSRPK